MWKLAAVMDPSINNNVGGTDGGMVISTKALFLEEAKGVINK